MSTVKIANKGTPLLLTDLEGLSQEEAEEVFYKSMRKLAGEDSDPAARARLFYSHMAAEIKTRRPRLIQALNNAYQTYVTEYQKSKRNGA